MAWIVLIAIVSCVFFYRLGATIECKAWVKYITFLKKENIKPDAAWRALVWSGGPYGRSI